LSVLRLGAAAENKLFNFFSDIKKIQCFPIFAIFMPIICKVFSLFS